MFLHLLFQKDHSPLHFRPKLCFTSYWAEMQKADISAGPYTPTSNNNFLHKFRHFVPENHYPIKHIYQNYF
jgi:hypothetical protein